MIIIRAQLILLVSVDPFGFFGRSFSSRVIAFTFIYFAHSLSLTTSKSQRAKFDGSQSVILLTLNASELPAAQASQLESLLPPPTRRAPAKRPRQARRPLAATRASSPGRRTTEPLELEAVGVFDQMQVVSQAIRMRVTIETKTTRARTWK